MSINLNPFVYLAFDKGNEKGNNNLAKFLCWYDTVKQMVQTYLLDVDCIDKDTTDVFAGMKHSLARFSLPMVNRASFLFVVKDNGGGGTLYASAKLIASNNMMRESYLVASYTLHNIQTTLRNAVVNILGEGGTGNNGEHRLNIM